MDENQALTTVVDQPPAIPADVSTQALEAAIGLGDFSKLSPSDRLKYIAAICKTTGLNPLTKPFDYIVLDGKLTLYANKGCAEQLRSNRNVSVQIVERRMEHGCLIVQARATRRVPGGADIQDESVAAVPATYPERYKTRDGDWKQHPKAGKPLEGAEMANAMMKCETKAKRRVTLSICGLGIIDESELDTVNGAAKALDVATTAEDAATTINAEIVASPAPEQEPKPEPECAEAPEPAKPEPKPEPEAKVEPAATVDFPAQLVQAIGPNNLGAAVRWMLNNKWMTSEQAMDENPFKFVAQANAEKVLKRPAAFLRAIGVTK